MLDEYVLMDEDVSTDHPVVLFDGVCNLCNEYVQFLIHRDPDAVFRFAPLQSPIAEDLLADSDIDPNELDSIVLVENGTVYEKSGAVLRVAAHIGGVYRLLVPFRYVPGGIRNAVYDFVATRRYRWFGKRDQCMMPPPDVETQFLAGGPVGEPASED